MSMILRMTVIDYDVVVVVSVEVDSCVVFSFFSDAVSAFVAAVGLHYILDCKCNAVSR